LILFGKIQFINDKFIEKTLYLNQINSTIEQFKLILPNNLLRLFELMRNITNINQFIEASYYALPHFYTRCYPIESLFTSTMECFYDNNPCFHITFDLLHGFDEEKNTFQNTKKVE